MKGKLRARPSERDGGRVGVVWSSVQRAGDFLGGAGDRLDAALLRAAQLGAADPLPTHRTRLAAVGTPATLRHGRDRRPLPARKEPAAKSSGRHPNAW